MSDDDTDRTPFEKLELAENHKCRAMQLQEEALEEIAELVHDSWSCQTGTGWRLLVVGTLP